jgi:PAS domain S-box-containing protein
MATLAPTDRLTLRSIRFRAALLTSILVALGLIAVISFTFWATRRSLIQAGEGRAAGIAAQLAGLLGPPIPLRVAELSRLVDDDRLRRALLEPSPAAESAAFQRLQSMAASGAQQHSVVELWTAAGRRVAARQFPPANNSVPVLDSPPAQVGVLPFTIVGDGVIVLEVVIPIPAQDGAAPVGHLVSRRVAINTGAPDTLNRLVGDGGRVLLGNQNGTVWTGLGGRIEPPPIDAATAGLHRYAGANGETRLVGVAHLAGTPLAVGVEFAEHTFTVPAWSLLQLLATVGVVFTLLSVAVVWRLSARVTRPLDDLTAAARRMSAGDFSARVDTRGDSEVGRLGAAFNVMAAQIEQGLADLQARAEELREKDQRKAAMMNAALDCIITTDAAGRVIECNPAAERMFGYSHDEILGRDISVMLGMPRFREYHARQHWTAARSDGSTFPAEATMVSIRTGGLDAFAAFVRDLTDQQAGEASLRRGIVLEEENRRVQEASRLKSEFLANMSHELRTPLNAIIGFAELLYDGQVTPAMPQFKDFMHDILTSGQHLLQLINDVLDLSKVEAGRLEFHPEETSLTQLVAETLSVLRPLAAQKQLSLTHQIDPAVERVFIDRSRFKQVLYNFVSNAIKFTPERGTVAIRLAADRADAFRLDVTDTGIGITAADQARLFVEFTQLEGGAAKKHQGTGLGLALTRRLVEAQGGQVGVVSTPGSGTTFSAILPRRATTGTPLADPRSIPSRRVGAPSVLVIEDDPRDQDAIVQTLGDAGFNIETANSRAQAVSKLQTHAFDAITLDLILPDANGADLLKDIRASERNRDVPVVVITIVGGSGTVSGFAVHDILTKPVDGPDVIAALARAGVSAGGGGTVLVVDDDPGSLRLMAASLQQLGYRSTAVERASDGLRICERDAPLAVVLDLQMPEIDGFGFLDRFRRLPNCQQVPVIVWTVKDLTPADLERLKRSAQGVMHKGQSGRSVVEELRRFVVERQARP